MAGLDAFLANISDCTKLPATINGHKVSKLVKNIQNVDDIQIAVFWPHPECENFPLKLLDNNVRYFVHEWLSELADFEKKRFYACIWTEEMLTEEHEAICIPLAKDKNENPLPYSRIFVPEGRFNSIFQEMYKVYTLGAKTERVRKNETQQSTEPKRRKSERADSPIPFSNNEVKETHTPLAPIPEDTNVPETPPHLMGTKPERASSPDIIVLETPSPCLTTMTQESIDVPDTPPATSQHLQTPTYIS